MSRYVLMPAAKEDLAGIRDYYLAEAGYRVARQMAVEFADAFRFLARTPGAGHVRQDLAEDRPILFWPLRDYLTCTNRQRARSRSFRSSAAAGTSRH